MRRPRSRPLGLSTPILALLTLPILPLASACGGSSGPTAPPPADNPQPPTGPEPIIGPPPQGQVIYAADDENNLLMFGAESVDAVSRAMKISGIPFLQHVVGIGFHPSNGKLYGVATDGRLYVIDHETGVATAVSGAPFTTEIGVLNHYGMSFDPATERIRLISGGGKNWSIDPADGTAIRQADIHYAPGDPNEGKVIGSVGFAYVPAGAPDIPELDGVLSHVGAGGQFVGANGDPVEALLYDYVNGNLAGTIDPETGEFQSLGSVDGINNTTCATMEFDPSGFLWALAPLAAVVSPELAGSYALLRMSGTGVASYVAGAIEIPAIERVVWGSIQTMTFFKKVAGE